MKIRIKILINVLISKLRVSYSFNSTTGVSTLIIYHKCHFQILLRSSKDFLGETQIAAPDPQYTINFFFKIYLKWISNSVKSMKIQRNGMYVENWNLFFSIKCFRAAFHVLRTLPKFFTYFIRRRCN